ncbi:hypothetical protein FOA43_002851 [Brettanomyces nanus]|uniref:RING-type domain-containing protein n=1 Tax=Eeniella nana TaxID=13502 RepID=A0A875S2C5_EENNA|nr:uncharacterized protein FOA43_002851 [Brettanomyces nanus]QPG75496.1 hypothetical protein FOA43_002851 [Brettanomyces nanus]
MSSYAAEHNIRDDEESEDSEDQTTQVSTGQRIHPTLNQALAQFHEEDHHQVHREEGRQVVDSMMSYVVPGNGDNQLFSTMMNFLLSSPATITVLGRGEATDKGGVDNKFLDTLDRVSLKELPKDARCPICTNEFQNDEYPLVVRLPCDSRHCFDLECISPWLKMNKTCPLCREDITIVRKKRLEKLVDEARKENDENDKEEEEEGEGEWEMYG